MANEIERFKKLQSKYNEYKERLAELRGKKSLLFKQLEDEGFESTQKAKAFLEKSEIERVKYQKILNEKLSELECLISKKSDQD